MRTAVAVLRTCRAPSPAVTAVWSHLILGVGGATARRLVPVKVTVKRQRGSARSERDEQFHEFVADRRGYLVHTARLLTAGDVHLAEDLVQTALAKLYISWGAFRRATNRDGYARRALVNALMDERGRAWWKFERLIGELPERPGAGAPVNDTDPELSRALRELPPRMRAVIVFRFYQDLDVAETAEALGCSAGTVKSQTSRALDKLRVALEGRAAPDIDNPEAAGQRRIPRNPGFFPEQLASLRKGVQR
jgi:RNA polymerase sigma-70 factor (sigma-E family)